MAIIVRERLIEIGQAVAKGEKTLIENGAGYKLIDSGDFVKGVHRKVCTCKLKVGDDVEDQSKKQSKKSVSKRNSYKESGPEGSSEYSDYDQA
jgi:hypothetical protein